MELLRSQAIRHLGEQLACEYSGAVPPGRVIRLVAVTARRLRRAGYRGDGLVELTEATVRTELTRRVARAMSHRRIQSGRAAS